MERISRGLRFLAVLGIWSESQISLASWKDSHMEGWRGVETTNDASACLCETMLSLLKDATLVCVGAGGGVVEAQVEGTKGSTSCWSQAEGADSSTSGWSTSIALAI